MITKIGVVGAGTMGSGIALCVAQHGFTTLLFDSNATAIETAKKSISKNLSSLLEKNKLTLEEKTAIENRIQYCNEIKDCKADLIIEAIIEKVDIKTSVFNELALINSNKTIFTSNTSSLSINRIQEKFAYPDRFAGMHFFNPAQLMKLVEVVKGDQTSQDVIETLVEVCDRLQKTAVVCKDAPGFIVNRVARHYYLEAMKLVSVNMASIEQVDTIMESAGFKMGPFKLMDLIGNDINLAVTTSLYDACNQAIRFEPSPLQIQKVQIGALGKKTGKGFYNYS